MVLDRLARAVKDDPSFSILVWGPGDKHPHYPIRTALRDHLREYFARVQFSEDAPAPSTASRVSWFENLAFEERLHGTKADIIYLLLSSTGPRLELILYWGYKNVGPKLHVLVPEEAHEDSFIGRVTNDILARIPKYQLHRFPVGRFNKDMVCAYCRKHARDFYVSKHPAGPPDLDTTL